MDARIKVAMTIDYLFGRGVSQALPLDKLTLSFSKRTGRVKTISLNNRLVATFRSDGGVALTVHGARLLKRSPAFKENCVTVSDAAADAVAEGRSVFAKHVVRCGGRIRPGADVAVLDPRGEVIAVGRAILSSKMMKQFRAGVAVKVREGVKGKPHLDEARSPPARREESLKDEALKEWRRDHRDAHRPPPNPQTA